MTTPSNRALVAAARGRGKKPKRKPESALVRDIIHYLETQYKAVVIRVNSGMIRVGSKEDGTDRVFRGAGKGTSDIIALIPPRPGRAVFGNPIAHMIDQPPAFAAIEAKMPGKNPTPAQWDFLSRVKKAGGIAGVARNLHDVDELLK